METITNQLYEGMFLVDIARASSDWDGVIATIKRILERSGSEIISIKKWDDRKLTYDIKGQSRGVYILCYFRVDGRKIQEIENSIRLSEQIMRVLILNAEHMTPEDIEKETPAAKAEKEGIKIEEDTSEEEAVNQESEDMEPEEEQEEEEEQDYNETEDTDESDSDSDLND